MRKLRPAEPTHHVSTRIPASALARLVAAGKRAGLGPMAVLARLVIAWSEAHCDHGTAPGEDCPTCGAWRGGTRVRRAG